ncbi:TPA: hypothetical protein ACPVE0_001101 [Escherichia coli]
MKPTYEQLEQQVLDLAVQLANAESKCRELAAENAYLLNGASRELNTSWMFHKTMLGAQAALVCLTHGYQAAAREWLEGTTDEAGAEIPDDISVGELHEWFESNMVSNGGNSGFLTRKEAEVAIRKECPATDAFLAEVQAQGVNEYASKRGFSFQHGSIHAHFGNGDVMVGSVTFENGDAGINFAPVRDKTGGVGTSYEWTNGKTTEQVDSVFTIASSNAEGLEVIRDKLFEAIAQLRKGGEA